MGAAGRGALPSGPWLALAWVLCCVVTCPGLIHFRVPRLLWAGNMVEGVPSLVYLKAGRDVSEQNLENSGKMVKACTIATFEMSDQNAAAGHWRLDRWAFLVPWGSFLASGDDASALGWS